MDLVKNVDICIETRQIAAELVQGVLKNFTIGSEADLRDALKQVMANEPKLFPTGWYDPPPGGIGVLFANEDNLERSRFPTLRQEPYWPRQDYLLTEKTVVMVYISPVDRSSGILGDLGFSFYKGNNQKIKDYLKLVLGIVEEIAEHVQIGMELRKIHEFGQNILMKNLLNNVWTTTFHDQTGTDLGHTIPWTHQKQTEAEKQIVKKGSMNELKNIISKNRLYNNHKETFVIPETIALTIEAQLSSTKNPELPNAYYHVIVAFRDGRKQIMSCFNPIFDTLGITFLRSNF